MGAVNDIKHFSIKSNVLRARCCVVNIVLIIVAQSSHILPMLSTCAIYAAHQVVHNVAGTNWVPVACRVGFGQYVRILDNAVYQLLRVFNFSFCTTSIQ